MSSKGRRRVTVDSSKALPDSSSSEKRKPSVFERLGQAPRSYEPQKGECHHWMLSGRCTYGNSCKYPHPPHLAAKRALDRGSDDLRRKVSRSSSRHTRDDSDSDSDDSSDSDSEDSRPREKSRKTSSSTIVKRDKDGKMKSQVVVTKHHYDSDSDASDSPPQPGYLDRDFDCESLIKQRQLIQRELSQLHDEDGESDRNSGKPEPPQVSSSSSDSSSDVATPLRFKNKHKARPDDPHSKKKSSCEKKKKKKVGKTKGHRSPSSESDRERPREKPVLVPKLDKEKERELERERERKEKAVKEKVSRKSKEFKHRSSSEDSRSRSPQPPRHHKDRRLYSDSSSEEHDRSPIERKKKQSIVAVKKKASPPEKPRKAVEKHVSPDHGREERMSRERVQEKPRRKQSPSPSPEKMKVRRQIALQPVEISPSRHQQESLERGRTKHVLKRSITPVEDVKRKKIELESRERLPLQPKSKRSVSPRDAAPSRQYLEVKGSDSRKSSRTPEKTRHTPQQDRSVSADPMRTEKQVKEVKRLRKPERPEQQERERVDKERIVRHEPTDRGDRVNREKQERTERVEQLDRGERHGRLDRPERQEKVEHVEKVDRAERQERSRQERPDRTERSRPDRHERERPEQVERSDRQEKTDRTERPDRLERSDRQKRQERPERSERPERTEKPDRTERVERTERSDRTDKADRHESPASHSRSEGKGQRQVTPEVRVHKSEQWEKPEPELPLIPLNPVQERLKRLTEMSSADLIPVREAGGRTMGRERMRGEEGARELDEDRGQGKRGRDHSRRRNAASPEPVEQQSSPEKRGWRQRQQQPQGKQEVVKARRKRSKEGGRGQPMERGQERERDPGAAAEEQLRQPRERDRELIDHEPVTEREMREMQRQAQLYEQERDRLHAIDVRQREIDHRGHHLPAGDARGRPLPFEEYSDIPPEGLSPASYDRYVQSHGRGGRYEEVLDLPQAVVEAPYPLMDEREERYMRERLERERVPLDRHGQPREGRDVKGHHQDAYLEAEMYRGDMRRRDRGPEAHGRGREPFPEEAMVRERGRYDERERFRHEAEQYAMEQATRRQWEEHEARMASREVRPSRSYDRRQRGRGQEEEILLAQNVRVHREGSPASSHHSAGSRSRNRHDVMERDQYARDWQQQQQEDIRIRRMQQLELPEERGRRGSRDRSSSRFREEVKRRRSPSMDQQYIQDRKRSRMEHDGSGSDFARERFEESREIREPVVIPRRDRREEGPPATEWPEGEEPYIKEERRHREELMHIDPHRLVDTRETRGVDPRSLDPRALEVREPRTLEVREPRGFEERVRRSPSRSSLGSRKSHRDEAKRGSESSREHHSLERPPPPPPPAAAAERDGDAEREVERERDGAEWERDRRGRDRGDWDRRDRSRGNWEKREDRGRREVTEGEDGGDDGDLPPPQPTVTPLMDLPPPPNIAELENKDLMPVQAEDEGQLEDISDDDLDDLIEKANADQADEAEDKPVQVDIVDIDWKSLIESTKPKPSTQGSALKRFLPHNILTSIGVSRALAGDTLMSKVITLCQNNQPDVENLEKKPEDVKQELQVMVKQEPMEQEDKQEEQELKIKVEPGQEEPMDADVTAGGLGLSEVKSKAVTTKFEFLHDIAGFHALATRRRQERLGLLHNLGPFRQALCARRDLRIRQQLCHMEKEVEGDLFPAQVVDNDLYKQSLQLFKHDKDLVVV